MRWTEGGGYSCCCPRNPGIDGNMFDESYKRVLGCQAFLAESFQSEFNARFAHEVMEPLLGCCASLRDFSSGKEREFDAAGQFFQNVMSKKQG